MTGRWHLSDRGGKAARPLLGAALLLALAACQDGRLALGALGGGGGSDAGGGAVLSAAGQTTELVERDVEAPEVFQVSEQGLWDGRPSLGGVWVAHPDVTDPERVIIRNTETGAFVIGALFRRERENPGPALQVSSDAAEALQMLAGAPTALNVTALRREEAPAPDPVLPMADLASEPGADTTGAIPLAEPGAITATPLDAAPAPAPTGDLVADLAAALPPATAPDAALPAPVVLDGPAPAVPAPPAPAASGLSQPFIQIGIFSIEANARGAAADLDAQGLPARVVAGETQGSAFWRVIVGPAQSEAERAGYLDRVKAEGFADAYFVRN